MGVNRNAAAIVAHGDTAVGVQDHLDAIGVSGNGFIHCIVQHLRHEMMERALVGAADIHAGTAANRFQTLQDLDVPSGVLRGGTAGHIVEKVGHGGASIGTHGRHAQAGCSTIESFNHKI